MSAINRVNEQVQAVAKIAGKTPCDLKALESACRSLESACRNLESEQKKA
jgi:hypothetical protein